MELNSSGGVQALNGYGADGWRGRYYPGSLTFPNSTTPQSTPDYGYQGYEYLYDPQGNLVQRQRQYNNAADVMDTTLYDAYGQPIADTDVATGQPEAYQDPVGFGGQHGYYYDTESGLSLLTNRYYAPKTGRFITRDPIGYSGGINLYGFVGNDPVNEMDPSGYQGTTLERPPTPPTTEPDDQPVRVLRGGRLLRWVQAIAESPFGKLAFRGSLIVTLTLNPTRLADDSLWPQIQAMRKARSRAGTYARPFHYRKGVREKVWDEAVAASPDGEVRDPTTDQIIHKNDKWVMGHRPGWEFRKQVESAVRRGIDRSQFLDEYNNPDHYRPELHGPNSSHKSEAPDDVNYWP